MITCPLCHRENVKIEGSFYEGRRVEEHDMPFFFGFCLRCPMSHAPVMAKSQPMVPYPRNPVRCESIRKVDSGDLGNLDPPSSLPTPEDLAIADLVKAVPAVELDANLVMFRTPDGEAVYLDAVEARELAARLVRAADALDGAGKLSAATLHSFVVVGSGTLPDPKRFRCRHCGYERALMPPDSMPACAGIMGPR